MVNRLRSFLSSCHPVILSFCHHVIMSSCHPVIMSSCHHVIMSSCHQQVIMSSGHHVIRSSCHQVIMSSGHHVIMSSCHPVNMSSIKSASLFQHYCWLTNWRTNNIRGYRSASQTNTAKWEMFPLPSQRHHIVHLDNYTPCSILSVTSWWHHRPSQ